jgi:hypothetical protein
VAAQAWEKDVKSCALERLNADWNEALDKLLESKLPKEFLDKKFILQDSSEAGRLLSREDFKNWAKPLIEAGRGSEKKYLPREFKYLGFMDIDTLDALERFGVKRPSAAYVAMTDVDPGHSQRFDKKNRDAALDIDDFYDLPNILADTSRIKAVLLDTRKGTNELLLVFDERGERFSNKSRQQTLKGKFVIRLDMETKFEDGTVQTLNRVITAGLVPFNNLADRNAYTRLIWNWGKK